MSSRKYVSTSFSLRKTGNPFIEVLPESWVRLILTECTKVNSQLVSLVSKYPRARITTPIETITLVGNKHCKVVWPASVDLTTASLEWFQIVPVEEKNLPWGSLLTLIYLKSGSEHIPVLTLPLYIVPGMVSTSGKSVTTLVHNFCSDLILLSKCSPSAIHSIIEGFTKIRQWAREYTQ
jgi:hypothetical protein